MKRKNSRTKFLLLIVIYIRRNICIYFTWPKFTEDVPNSDFCVPLHSCQLPFCSYLAVYFIFCWLKNENARMHIKFCSYGIGILFWENEVICTFPSIRSAEMTTFCWVRKIWKVLFARHCQLVRFDLSLGSWEEFLRIHLCGQLSRIRNAMLHHVACSQVCTRTQQVYEPNQPCWQNSQRSNAGWKNNRTETQGRKGRNMIKKDTFIY